MVSKLFTSIVTAVIVGKGYVTRADTFTTNIIGYIRINVEENRSATAANPFLDDKEPFETEGLAQTLAANGMNGDLLHVWTGRNFNSYVLEDGTWKIVGTDATIPTNRLNRDFGKNGTMITRKSVGTTTIEFIGTVPRHGEVGIQVVSGKWTMIAYPFATDIKLNEVDWDGADDGDRIRVWNTTNNSWRVFEHKNNVWIGDGVFDLVVPAASSFLYFNSSMLSKTLRFLCPFSLE